ncbi:MAG: tetratricopeptide repeat protein [Chloroflexi bacterium]|nr:tetratricopeptide repeat protein [Chloroflexota bacterium]
MTRLSSGKSKRAHFLLLCTPGTFDRINDPGDWLRREIEHAMLHKRNIVPILASDFKFDAAITQRFTGKLAELPRYNALNAPHDYFEEALERLRMRFLNLPVSVMIAVTPATDVKLVAAKQAEIENLQRASVERLSASEHYARGIDRQNLQDIDGAIADFSAAIQLEPRYANAYLMRSSAYLEKKDFKNAIADITTVIHLSPKNVKAHYARGIILRDNGEFALALADFKRYLELTKDEPVSDTRFEVEFQVYQLTKKLGLQ